MNLLFNSGGGVDVYGVVGCEGVASVGPAVVGHQAGGPVHTTQVQSSLQHTAGSVQPTTHSKFSPAYKTAGSVSLQHSRVSPA